MTALIAEPLVLAERQDRELSFGKSDTFCVEPALLIFRKACGPFAHDTVSTEDATLAYATLYDLRCVRLYVIGKQNHVCSWLNVGYISEL